MPAKKLLFVANTRFLAENRNLFGGLQGDVRKRLLAVLNTPCQTTWDDAHTIIITGERSISLWQALITIDPTFPRSKPSDNAWPQIPDQFTLCRAIRTATKTVKAEVEPERSGGSQHD